jgi:hypothetical protein
LLLRHAMASSGERIGARKAASAARTRTAKSVG